MPLVAMRAVGTPRPASLVGAPASLAAERWLFKRLLSRYLYW